MIRPFSTLSPGSQQRELKTKAPQMDQMVVLAEVSPASDEQLGFYLAPKSIVTDHNGQFKEPGRFFAIPLVMFERDKHAKPKLIQETGQLSPAEYYASSSGGSSYFKVLA